MGIKFDEKRKSWTAWHVERHPLTRVPKTLRRINLASEAEARRVERELVKQVAETFTNQKAPKWGRLLDNYFKHLGDLTDLKKTTIYNRETVLRHHTRLAWENKRIDEISTVDIHKLIQGQLGESAESHKKFLLKCLKSVFQYAVDSGALDRNPTPMIKFKVGDKIKSVLNQDQIVRLLKRAQELDWQWYPHYAAALYLGLRNGELYALTWDKVNLDQRQVLVNCSWNNKDGYKSTKSGDDRIVEIPKPLMPVLAELKLQAGGSQFVLPRLSKWDKGEQARELRLFLKSIGLPEVRFHDLRASWATLLLGKGVAPSKVMSMGGWKDMDTMMIYMRKAGIDIKDATACLDSMNTHGVKDAEVINLTSM